MSDVQDGYEWVFLLVLAYPGSPGPKAIKWLCVCVCVTRAKMPEDGHWRTVTLCSWLSDGVVAACCLLQPGTLKPLCVTSSMVAA